MEYSGRGVRPRPQTGTGPETAAGVDDELTRAELEERLARETRARELVRAAAVPAPSGLRARVEDMRAAAGPARRRRAVIAGGLALAGVAAAVILVLLLLPSGIAAPTVERAVALSELPATAAGPARRPDEPALLEAAVGDVAFPAWAAEFGWKATGLRTDEIGGRDTVTVFYGKEGRTLAYTIVSGDGLEPPGVDPEVRDGVAFRVVEGAAGTSVVWERGGHTCVLTGTATPAPKMVDLAAWTGGGAITAGDPAPLPVADRSGPRAG